ncbi:hypothetical protein C7999DRAFT_14790, partial [Corynascus novoguineensis]
LTTMGSLFSQPEESKVKVLANPIRDSVALRQRISLNRQTLARILEQIGHPAANRASQILSESSLQSEEHPEAPKSPSIISYRKMKRMSVLFQRTILKRQTRKFIDLNKPLPPPPLPPDLAPISTQTAADFAQIEQALEQEYIKRHREETLRQLESRRRTCASEIRVPSIILRRIGKRAMDGFGRL